MAHRAAAAPSSAHAIVATCSWSVPQQPPTTRRSIIEPSVGVQRAELVDVAAVQLGGLVELGVAQAGGVGSHACTRASQGAPASSSSRKCVGWAQLTM